jgi:hypothetical protein
MKKSVVWLTASVFASLVLIAGVGELRAGIEQKFAGKIFILKKRPPSYFKSQGAFSSFLRKNSMKVVSENEDHEWVLRTFAFFKRQLGDYEVEMVFYNIEKGKDKNRRQFVDSFTQMTQNRNTKSLEGKATLTRPSFDGNTSYMVVAQASGTDLAKGYFSTRGMTQETIDEQKRILIEQKKMEESMHDLQAKAKKQEEDDKLRAQGIDPDARPKRNEPSENNETVEVSFGSGGEEEDNPQTVDPHDNARGCSTAVINKRSHSLLNILATVFR